MSKPKPPKPVDPYQTAQTQWQFGNFNQTTPWGNINFTAPANGQPGSMNLTLSPEQQRQLDLQNQLTEGALTQAQQRQGQLGNLPDLPSSLDMSRIRGIETDFSGDRQRVEQAYFNRARGLLDPVFEDQERSLRTTLADQGLPAGGEARNYDLGQFFDQRNTALSRAAQEAILAGGDEQSRMFDINMRAREGEINDQLQNANLAGTNRATQFNELQALLGQQQVAQPSLKNFYGPQGSDFLGAQALNQAGANNQFAAQNDLYGGILGGLFNLGSSYLSNPNGLGGLFGGGGGAGQAGGAAGQVAGGMGSGTGGAAGAGGSIGNFGSIGGGAASGLGGLVAGAQPGIQAGIAGTAAANEAALLGGAAPTLAGTGGAAAGGAAAGGGAAGGGAASGAAAGTTAGGLAAGLGVAALPAAIFAMGGFANDRTARNQLALQQSGLEQVQLAGGTRALLLPDGSKVAFNDKVMEQIREKWGVVPTNEFYAWLATLPKLEGDVRRLPGRTPGDLSQRY